MATQERAVIRMEDSFVRMDSVLSGRVSTAYRFEIAGKPEKSVT